MRKLFLPMGLLFFTVLFIAFQNFSTFPEPSLPYKNLPKIFAIPPNSLELAEEPAVFLPAYRITGRVDQVLIDQNEASAGHPIEYIFTDKTESKTLHLKFKRKFFGKKNIKRLKNAIKKELLVDLDGQLDVKNSVFYVEAINAPPTQMESAAVDEEPAQVGLEGTRPPYTFPPDQITGVVVFDFIDQKNSLSIADFNAYIDDNRDSISRFYWEVSRHNLQIHAKVFGPIQSGIKTSDFCDFSNRAVFYKNVKKLKRLARRATKKFTVGKFMFSVPDTPTCGFNGIASGIPGRWGVILTKKDYNFDQYQQLFAHEFGHLLGLYHSGLDRNDETDPIKSYADHSDIMGKVPDLLHLTAPHMDQLGWIPQAQIRVVNQNGTYSLEPLELRSPMSSPQILKIPVPGFAGHFYYLSLRSGIGRWGKQLDFDCFGSRSCFKNRLSIHVAPYIRYGSVAGEMSTQLAATLASGESFYLPGARITFDSQGPDGIGQVSIELNHCTPISPKLEINQNPLLVKVTGQQNMRSIFLEPEVKLIFSSPLSCSAIEDVGMYGLLGIDNTSAGDLYYKYGDSYRVYGSTWTAVFASLDYLTVGAYSVHPTVGIEQYADPGSIYFPFRPQFYSLNLPDKLDFVESEKQLEVQITR